FQAEDGIRDKLVTGVQTCALPIFHKTRASCSSSLSSHSETNSHGLSVSTLLASKRADLIALCGRTPFPLNLSGMGELILEKQRRSEERRVGKGVDYGGGLYVTIIK